MSRRMRLRLEAFPKETRPCVTPPQTIQTSG
jgi:hypothetical protein